MNNDIIEIHDSDSESDGMKPVPRNGLLPATQIMNIVDLDNSDSGSDDFEPSAAHQRLSPRPSVPRDVIVIEDDGHASQVVGNPTCVMMTPQDQPLRSTHSMQTPRQSSGKSTNQAIPAAQCLDQAKWPHNIIHLGDNYNPDGISFPAAEDFRNCGCRRPCRYPSCMNAKLHVYCSKDCCPFEGNCGIGLNQSASGFSSSSKMAAMESKQPDS